MWDHTVLPATRQRWYSYLYHKTTIPSRQLCLIVPNFSCIVNRTWNYMSIFWRDMIWALYYLFYLVEASMLPWSGIIFSGDIFPLVASRCLSHAVVSVGRSHFTGRMYTLYIMSWECTQFGAPITGLIWHDVMRPSVRLFLLCLWGRLAAARCFGLWTVNGSCP